MLHDAHDFEKIYNCLQNERFDVEKLNFPYLYNTLTSLTENVQVVASENEPVCWTTPLGLPVVQPYRKVGRHLVSAILHSIPFSE